MCERGRKKDGGRERGRGEREGKRGMRDVCACVMCVRVYVCTCVEGGRKGKREGGGREGERGMRGVCACVCVCMCVCVCVCMACVFLWCACMHACVCTCAYVYVCGGKGGRKGRGKEGGREVCVYMWGEGEGGSEGGRERDV